MKVTARGLGDHDYCLVVGIWDPVIPAHLRELRRIARSARTRGHECLAAVLDPAPSLLLSPESFTTYHDRAAKIELIKSAGIDHTLCCSMTKSELELGAKWFISQVREYARIASMEVGHRQSLGPGDSGSHAAITSSCRRNGITLFINQKSYSKHRLAAARRLLMRGEVRAATNMIRLPPAYDARSIQRLNGCPPGLYTFEFSDKIVVSPYGETTKWTVQKQSADAVDLATSGQLSRFAILRAGPADE